MSNTILHEKTMLFLTDTDYNVVYFCLLASDQLTYDGAIKVHKWTVNPTVFY